MNEKENSEVYMYTRKLCSTYTHAELSIECKDESVNV